MRGRRQGTLRKDGRWQIGVSGIEPGTGKRKVIFCIANSLEEAQAKAHAVRSGVRQGDYFTPVNLPANQKNCVYFVVAELAHKTLVKIGFASNMGRRMIALQIGSPVPLRIEYTHPGGRELERALHYRFKHYRSHGEWFEFTEDIKAEIGMMRAGMGMGRRALVIRKKKDADQALVQ